MRIRYLSKAIKTTSVIALVLSAVSQDATAISIDVTWMNFNSEYATQGILHEDGSGYFKSIDDFFGQPFLGENQVYYEGEGTYIWQGEHGTGPYSYEFELTGNEVAFGLTLYFGSGNGTPVLSIMDCGDSNQGDACIGRDTVMQLSPFAGQSIAFDGVVVPIPASIWLMGTGVIGLISFERTRREARV